MTEINDRIRKLIAMAEGEGGNENEMKNAMAMASQLMMKHGITRDALMTAPAQIVEGERIPVQYDWYRFAIHAAMELYAVKGMNYTQPDGSVNFRFIGRPDNVEVAETVFAYIVVQVEAAYKASLPKGLDKKARATYRKTFKVHCANRVLQRARAAVIEQTTDDVTAQQTGGTALVVLNHRQKLEEEIDAYMDVKHSDAVTKKARQSKAKVDILALLAAQRAGDKVDLARPNDTKRVGNIKRIGRG